MQDTANLNELTTFELRFSSRELKMCCAVRENTAKVLHSVKGPLPSAGGRMVQNPTNWRAKECDKTPLGNINKEKSHFFS